MGCVSSLSTLAGPYLFSGTIIWGEWHVERSVAVGDCLLEATPPPTSRVYFLRNTPQDARLPAAFPRVEGLCLGCWFPTSYLFFEWVINSYSSEINSIKDIQWELFHPCPNPPKPPIENPISLLYPPVCIWAGTRKYEYVLYIFAYLPYMKGSTFCLHLQGWQV